MSRILVVEDNEAFRNVLTEMLIKAGYEVQAASNGNQALVMCEEFRPDLVITDIIMPDKEGLETIQEFQSRCPDLRIIAMSGGGKFGPDSYLPLAKKLGAKACLQKPFMRDELLSTIQSVLEQ